MGIKTRINCYGKFIEKLTKIMNEVKNVINETNEVVANEGICNVVENEAYVAEEVLESVETDTVAKDTVADDTESVDVETLNEDDGAEVERLIAEAEARGYERGRNEGIEAWLQEGRSKMPAGYRKEPESEVIILNNMRKSVWE